MCRIGWTVFLGIVQFCIGSVRIHCLGDCFQAVDGVSVHVSSNFKAVWPRACVCGLPK